MAEISFQANNIPINMKPVVSSIPTWGIDIDIFYIFKFYGALNSATQQCNNNTTAMSLESGDKWEIEVS